jgi:hypothetical protein
MLDRNEVMVWALIEPSGFCEFFPYSNMENDYGKWHERMAEHFSQMPHDLKTKYGNDLATYNYVVSSKFTKEQGSRITDVSPPIGPLEPHEKPDEFITSKKYSSLGSLIKLNDRLLAVDKPLKEIIERLEPGVHNFWQMMITMPEGAVYPMQYYGMVIGQFLDSFSLENCTEGIWEESEGYYTARRQQKEFVSGLAFSRKAFGGAHLWRERKIYNGNILLSDTLQAEIVKSNLRLPKLVRTKEVAAIYVAVFGEPVIAGEV